MHLFIFFLKYLLTCFPFKHILTVEWNEKYALQSEKQKSLTQFWAIMPITHRQYLYCYTKKNIINSEFDCRSVKNFRCKQKLRFLLNIKIYSANLFSDLHPKCSVMVTHVTIFQYFVKRTKEIGYR